VDGRTGRWLSIAEAAERLGLAESAILDGLVWGAYGARLSPEGRCEIWVTAPEATADSLGDTVAASSDRTAARH
jgi:hypothetical protein